MNIATMSSFFDLIQDKSGSPYFTASEKSIFINRAQVEFVDELFDGDNKRKPNIEMSQDTIGKIAPLIYDLPSQNMNSSGIITKASVSSALAGIDASAVLWRPLSIGWEFGSIKKPVSYVRNNDRWKLEDNFFKKASITSPKVRETASSYVFAPINTSPKIYFTVLKYPKEVNITSNISSDLPDNTHNRILSIALELAGIGSRDTLMTQLLQLQSQNK